MLTRSASKRQAGSPAKSVEKSDEIKTLRDNSIQSHKVKIQSNVTPNGKGDKVCLHNVNLNFNVVPPKTPAENISNELVLNFHGMVINLYQADSNGETRTTCKTNNNCTCSPPSFKTKTRKKYKSKNLTHKDSDEEYTDGSYVRFSPEITSSVRRSSRLHKQQNIEWDKHLSYVKLENFESSTDLPCKQMEVQESMADNEKYISQESPFYKGVLINDGYNPEDFKKKSVVRIVPLSEEEIGAWSKPVTSEDNTVLLDGSEQTLSSSTSSPNSTDSSNEKPVRRTRLMETLKLINLFLYKADEKSEMSAKGNDIGSFRRCLEPIFNEDGESCNGISSQDGMSVGEISQHAVMVVDGLHPAGEKHVESVETDEGYNEEEATKWDISDQDSVMTDIFYDRTRNTVDESREHCHIMFPSLKDIPNVVGEIIDRLGLPAPEINPALKPPHSKSKRLAMDEDTIVDFDPINDVGNRMEVTYDCEEKARVETEQEIGGAARRDSTVLENEWNEVSADAELENIGSEEGADALEEESHNCNEEWKSGELECQIKENNVSIGCSISGSILYNWGTTGKESRDRTVMEIGAILKGESKYRDRWNLIESELRQIQLECIKKEMRLRRAESATPFGKKKSKSSRKSEVNENPLEDEVTDFASARKTRGTRRSEVVMEEMQSEWVKRTPGKRNTPMKQSTKEMDYEFEHDVTATPRSTRTKPRVNQEWRRGKSEEISPTPKRGKTPRKPSQSEETSQSDEKKDKGSRRSKAPEKTPMKQDEKERNESVDKEASSVSSTPKNIKSPKKTSQLEISREKLNEHEKKVMEVLSSPKLRKCISPMKSQAEVSKDLEFDENAIESVSSPLKKKKEAAERLRAEEERLEQSQMKKKEVAVTLPPFPKKNKSSTALSRTLDEIYASKSESVGTEMAAVSTPKLKKMKSPKKSQMGLLISEEESCDAEINVISSPKQKNTKFPEEQVAENYIAEECSDDIEIAIRSSSKRQKSHGEEQQLKETESEVVDMCKSPPKRHIGKSPTKHSQERIPEEIESDEGDLCVRSPHRGKKTNSSKRHDVESFTTEESESNDFVISSLLSGKRQKSLSSENWHLDQDESEESELEEYMGVVPSGKGKKPKSFRKEPLQVFLQNESDSGDLETFSIPSPKQKEKSLKELSGKEQEPEENDLEVADALVMVSPKRQKSKSSQKKLDEVGDPQETVADNAETCEVSSPKKKKKKLYKEKNVGETIEETNSDFAQIDEISFSRSKKGKSSNKEALGKLQDDPQRIIPRLRDDFLASIPSTKADVKINAQIESNTDEIVKPKKRKNKEKLKMFVGEEDYIPLNVAGPTKFAVMGLDKFKSSSPRHPAFEMKRDLLYGSRVKRIPYSQLQAYNLKVESRKMRF